MEMSIDEMLIEIKDKAKKDLKDEFIKSYFPFIVNSTYKITGKYVNIENDENLSIALEAFDEAIGKYNHDKGSFFNFAKIVIESRLIDFYRKNSKIETVSENLIEQQQDNRSDIESKLILKNEIKRFEGELYNYQISFDKLERLTPKHKDTKKTAIEVAKVVANDDLISYKMKKNKCLPRKEIMQKINVTDKQLKRSRDYIIAVAIVLNGDYDKILNFIDFDLGSDDNV